MLNTAYAGSVVMPNRKERRLSEAQGKKEPKITIDGKIRTLGKAFMLAVADHNAGNLAKAAEIYRLILQKDPRHAKSLNNLGHLFFLADELDDAIVLYRRALMQEPDYLLAMANLGEALVTKGNRQEAEVTFCNILSCDPTHAKSLYHLAHLRRYENLEHVEIQHMAALLKDDIRPADQKAYLHFGLGKIYDECGHYDEAFAHYRQANRACSIQTRYQPAHAEKEFGDIIQCYSGDFLSQVFPVASLSRRPVFIVGMPRSGTTLLANILSCHPAIAATGELQLLPQSATELPKQPGITDPYPWAVRQMTPEIATDIIRRYETRLSRDAKGYHAYVIDKHPINFEYLGFIAMLFPNASVIHCTREPRDTCLSNYFQYFDSSYSYSFDLAHIGHFYNGYVKLMEYWKQVLPLRMIDVHYEDTVLHTEETTRKILDFLGLEWDARCLSPQNNPHPVKTASMWQVRQPVYQHSVERWRHYEKHLGPLLESLQKPF